MYEGLSYIQLGKQASLAGGEVNATTRFRVQGEFQDNSEYYYPEEDVGIAGGVGSPVLIKSEGQLNIGNFDFSFEQGCYPLNMIHGATASQDGAGTGYVRTWNIPATSAPSPHYYTVEWADENDAYILTGAFCTGLTISGTKDGVITAAPVIVGRITGDGTTTATAAVAIPTVERPIFGQASITIDNVGDGFGDGSALASGLESFELSLPDILFGDYSAIGNATPYHIGALWNTKFESMLTYTIKHNASATAEDAARAAKTPRAIQIKIEGADLGTPGTYSKKTWIFNIAGTYQKPQVISRNNGILYSTFELKNHYDVTLATRGSIINVNELSALT